MARRFVTVAVVTLTLIFSGGLAAGTSISMPTRSLLTDVKTYKVILSKSDQGSNREVYIQATDSDAARKQARDQNPGWQVESVEESK